jgi:starch synthase
MASFSSTLRILFIASEADPFVKVGGLGDVAGSLPRALRSLEIRRSRPGEIKLDIRLVIPFHKVISLHNNQLRQVASFDVPHQDGNIPAEAYDLEIDDLPVYLIAGEPITREDSVYSGDPIKDGRKYTFFSLAALELCRALGWQPHLLHANDWHTAPAVYALSTLYAQDPFFAQISTLLSVHNLPYLGVGTGLELKSFGLPPAKNSTLPGWAQDLPLPLGLLTADHIVAVSDTYAKEILTPEFGSGLYDFLRTRQDSISGILNGLDQERWNPVKDPSLPFNFTRETLAARQANKIALQTELGLDTDPGKMLLAMITRMDHQKGVDLALAALRILAQDEKTALPDRHPSWQAVILGTGTPELEEAAHQMEIDFPEQVRAALRFDSALSRRIYGSADALLIPSRYEPCGLAQMIAMRYACIPIARSTGGLRDTVYDYDQSDNPRGFLFEKASAEALAEAVRRALQVYAEPARWRDLQRNGMIEDFSWERSARQYLALYETLSLRRQGFKLTDKDIENESR